MRGIKILKTYYYYLLIFLVLGCQEDNLTDFSDENLAFVRFGLQLDEDENLVEDIFFDRSLPEVDAYTHHTLSTIRIPVLLSMADRSSEVNIGYRLESNREDLEGDLYMIEPGERNIRFAEGEAVSYLDLSFLRVWESEEKVELTFILDSTDDPDIMLGYPRSENRMDSLTIEFGGTDILNTYGFTTSQLYFPQGENTIEFEVAFSTSFLVSELGEDPDLLEIRPLSICQNGAAQNYEIIRTNYRDGTNRISYQINVDDISEEEEFMLEVSLRADIHPRYTIGDIQRIVMIKRAILPRIDFPAATLWHNTSDPFHRLFGEAWYFKENDGVCAWQSFFTATQPVAVAADDPMNDGNGFHKYRVAHRGSNVGTNPFNTRRYYGGTRAESPAFWLEEAMEFYPDSENTGKVRVIPKNLLFVRRSDRSVVNIPFCGGGTYGYNSELDAMEMYLELHYDETHIGGPEDVVHQMYLYSPEIDVEPALLMEECVQYTEL